MNKWYLLFALLLGLIDWTQTLIDCNEAAPISDRLIESAASNQVQSSTELSSQQKARIVYDFALNGEDYCQLQRYWDEHDKNGTKLGYFVRPKKNEIYRYKEQLFKVGILDDQPPTLTPPQSPPPPSLSASPPASPPLTTTPTPPGPAPPLPAPTNSQIQVNHQENESRNRTSTTIEPHIADESKLTEEDESFLLRTVISSSNLPLGDMTEIKGNTRNNKTRKESFESDIKKLGQRRLSLLFKRLSDNINLKEHSSGASLDYEDNLPSIINSTRDPEDAKILYYEQAARANQHIGRNTTIKMFNVFHYESRGQIHYIYWLLDNAYNQSKRFVAFDEVQHLIDENLSWGEIHKIMSDLTIIKLVEPYQDKRKQEDDGSVTTTTKDEGGPMSFLQTYLPKSQSFNSWEIYVIAFILLVLFLILLLALIILCCRTSPNQQQQRQQIGYGADDGKPKSLGLAESSTYLSFNQEGSGQDNSDPFRGKSSVWKKVSNLSDSEVSEAKREVGPVALQNLKDHRGAQFEWYSFEGKRIENVEPQRQQQQQHSHTATSMVEQETGRQARLSTHGTQSANNDQQVTSAGSKANYQQQQTSTRQILWAQDLALLDHQKQDSQDQERRMGTFLVGGSQRNAGQSSFGGYDHQSNLSTRMSSELVMVKEKIVPIVKPASQSRNLIDHDTDQGGKRALGATSSPVAHDYINTPVQSLAHEQQQQQAPARTRQPPARSSRASKDRWTPSVGAGQETEGAVGGGPERTISEDNHHNSIINNNNNNNNSSNSNTAREGRPQRARRLHAPREHNQGAHPPAYGSIQVIQELTSRCVEAGAAQASGDSHARVQSQADADTEDGTGRRPTIIHIELSGRTQTMVDQIRDELTKIETRDTSGHRSANTRSSQQPEGGSPGPPITRMGAHQLEGEERPPSSSEA